MFQQRKPDLVLVHLRLADMDGLELIRIFRAGAGQGQIPIVAINTLELPGDREAALAAGANEYLKIPLRLEKLAEIVRALLENSGKVARV